MPSPGSPEHVMAMRGGEPDSATVDPEVAKLEAVYRLVSGILEFPPSPSFEEWWEQQVLEWAAAATANVHEPEPGRPHLRVRSAELGALTGPQLEHERLLTAARGLDSAALHAVSTS